MSYFSALVTALRSIYGRPKFRVYGLRILRRFLGALVEMNIIQNENYGITELERVITELEQVHICSSTKQLRATAEHAV